MQSAAIVEKNSHRWFIVAAVMLSTIMEILDTTIVTVSLPHMMGSLGADRDEISWVLTSYIVAAGVLMPLTGFLVGRLGSKRLLLINVVGFMLASACCGLSVNLTEMVIFRLLQGIFGASLVPVSQYILRETFPPEELPKAMAIWGVGVMAAPIMGPTLGGFITDLLNWRWIFYINVPVCVINFFLILRFIKSSTIKKEVIDWMGIVLMVVSVAALQLVLDRGSVDDWFDSATICWLTIIFLVTFGLFLWHSIRTPNAAIHVRIFLDRSFGFGTLIMVFFAASVLSCIALLPQLMETLLGYTSTLSGLTMAPRGIASGFAMAFGSRLMMRGVNARFLIAAGLALSAYSTWLSSTMTLDIGMHYLILLGLIQGLGIGLFFMPLSTMIYTTLPKTAIAEASGLFSFGRNIGNALGISLLTTFLSRATQANWNLLGSHIQRANPNLTHWLNAQGLSLDDPHTLGRLGNELSTQANFIAYSHTFRIAAWLLLIACFMSLFLKKPKNLHVAAAALE